MAQQEQRPADDRSKEEVYEEDFVPYIHKWGRRTNLLAVALSFGPAMVLLSVYGILPPAGAILGGFVSVLGAWGAFWLVEPISYYPVLGVSGTYMAFLSGNISNLRLPSSAAAQEAADVEIGTPEGDVISTLGIAGSIFVNVTILTVGVIGLVSVFQALPELWQSALELYLVPAIFGAIFAQFGRDFPKVAAVALGLAFVANLLLELGYFAVFPGDPIYVVIVVAVFGTMLVSKWMLDHGLISHDQ
ncbi:hypothetical protein [Natronococcus occultus]|uniref:Uncharacterized protein n=1 Tax=Natronococcus occultus SP4 TaxID=694430 RepID=L0K437_9EURY|nr:hypothetical protein [Natronococcus occultus]AGB38863.1 hypothetical protein Natoc_3122 [Natronococcus occultus SP4]